MATHQDLFGQIYSVSDAAGVDEVGRGPPAGPVMAAAVILDPDRPIEGLRDSKVLEAKEREALAALVRERSLSWAIARADVDEIDRINILRATLLAMRRAVSALDVTPSVAYIDGNIAPALPMPAITVIGGDGKVASISAASVIAKVARDAEMTEWAEQYPVYGFEKHKGYATPAHMAALDEHGPSPLHRKSFAPVTRSASGQMELLP